MRVPTGAVARRPKAVRDRISFDIKDKTVTQLQI